jgi:hypothetical protein
MTTRPSRSASIPIPRSSSAVSSSRNIESVITIPFAPVGRRQAIPQRHSIADDHTGVSPSYGARGSSSSSAIATSPIRSTARSMTYTGATHGRGSPRTTSTFEPRIVRATTESSRSVDAACLPSSSTSPSRTRRSSVANGRATSTQRQVSSHVSTPPPPPVSFARPAYLEHSALRHMLQTELPPALPPSRKTDTTTLDHQGYSAAMSPPTDSDEDSNVSPPRELPLAPPPPPISQDQILRLPTRWSDQFRHTLLTVSGDGRDLTYHGSFYPLLCGHLVLNLFVLRYFQKARRVVEIETQLPLGPYIRFPQHVEFITMKWTSLVKARKGELSVERLLLYKLIVTQSYQHRVCYARRLPFLTC